tara:strand:- start:1874 stop:2107 length:234 start_codon:yes stop_codon:yes gene_type:complete
MKQNKTLWKVIERIHRMFPDLIEDYLKEADLDIDKVRNANKEFFAFKKEAERLNLSLFEYAMELRQESFLKKAKEDK